MDSADRHLGLDRPITRRDCLNGVALTVAGSVRPSRGCSCVLEAHRAVQEVLERGAMPLLRRPSPRVQRDPPHRRASRLTERIAKRRVREISGS
jgi:hypothetical protein